MRKVLEWLIFNLISITAFAGGHTVTITQANVLCNGDCNGIANATVSGGIGPFVYSWSNGATGLTITGLCAATYSCTVIDNNDLSATNATVIITEPTVITLSTSTTSVTCGTTDGSAVVYVGGGISPYTYSWSNGATGMSISGLSANSYTVTITDSNNCLKTSYVAVSNAGGFPPVINKNDVSCNGGNNGSAVVFSSGSGTPPLTYLWTTGATGLTANNLSAGSYSISITDKYSCTSVSSIFITEPLPIIISTTTTNATNGQSNGSASISGGGGGSGILMFSWSNSVQGQTITGLSCGTYSVTATDDNACTASSTAVVTCVTGINELNNEIDFIIYPNPARTAVTIETTINQPYHIRVINLLGEIIYTSEESISNTTTINVGTLPKGIYIVQITNTENNTIGRQRLVVQ